MKLTACTVREILGGSALLIALSMSVLIAVSIFGLRAVVADAEEVVLGNEVHGLVAKREIDHLDWVRQLSNTLLDDTAVEVTVQTDPHQCAFGQWYYGDGRQNLIQNAPGLELALKSIEPVHNELHASAVEVAEHFSHPHGDLAYQLKDLQAQHILWTRELTAALADAASHRAASDNFDVSDFHVDVAEDPTQCGLGKFIASTEVRALRKSFLPLDKALDVCEQPHRALHASLAQITSAVKEADFATANRVFEDITLTSMEKVGDALQAAIEAENLSRQGFLAANEIFNHRTLPALAEMRRSLRDLDEASSKLIMTDEEMLRVAGFTRNTLMSAGFVVFALISVVLFLSTRHLTRCLRGVSLELGFSSEQVAAAARQVAAGSETLAQGASESAASLEETSASLEELAAQTQSNVSGARSAQTLALESGKVVSSAAVKMDSLSTTMKAVADSSEEMSKIIKSIDEIAFQTNLLALNAAVEAARAGEAGAGFAVVADEVRNLAMRATAAARDTSELIEGAVSQIQTGAKLTEESRNGFEQIGHVVDQISSHVSHIVEASEQQDIGIQQIRDAIQQMDQVTQSGASNAEESAAAAEELSGQSARLHGHVGRLMAMINREARSGEPSISEAAPIRRARTLPAAVRENPRRSSSRERILTH